MKVPYRHRKIVLELSKNKNIVILKQEKGKGGVVLDKHKHIEKCMPLLTTKHSKQVDNDPTIKIIKNTEITEKIEIKAFPI